MENPQRIGGIAAAVQAVMFVVIMVLIFGVFPGMGLATMADFGDPAKVLPLAGTPTMTMAYGIDVVMSLLVVLVALGVRDRLMGGAPATTRAAAVAASIAGALFLGEGMVNMTALQQLGVMYATDPAGASAAYPGVYLIGTGLFNGAVFAAGWFLLLAGWAAMKSGQLSRPLAYLLLLGGLLDVLAFKVEVLGLVGLVLGVVWSVMLAREMM